MPFEKVETQVDFPALERRRPRVLGRAPTSSRSCASKNARQAALVVPRRADHRQQPDGRPPRLGPHLQGRLQPLLRHDRPRAALPERLRLPGPVGRGRGREGTEAQDQARHREPRPRRPRRQHRPVRAARARTASNKFARVQTEQSIRLGYWMDWDRTDADWAKPPGRAASRTSRCRRRTTTRSGLPQEVPRTRAGLPRLRRRCRGAAAAASASARWR